MYLNMSLQDQEVTSYLRNKGYLTRTPGARTDSRTPVDRTDSRIPGTRADNRISGDRTGSRISADKDRTI